MLATQGELEVQLQSQSGRACPLQGRHEKFDLGHAGLLAKMRYAYKYVSRPMPDMMDNRLT
jgi:hypothetical protein